jgi:hypothetical protein
MNVVVLITMFSVALAQHNNLHKTAHVKYQYAYHTEFPVKSTFLGRKNQTFNYTQYFSRTHSPFRATTLRSAARFLLNEHSN